MKVVSEIGILEFHAWSGAVDTRERIISDGKADLFDQTIEELYPDGITDTELNDLL